MSAYRLAKKEDLPKLTDLWQSCFGDEPRQIGLFWDSLFERILVFMEESAGAMLCALPLHLVDEAGESLPAAYLYAVCTHPDCRGQGLCAGLMAFAEEALRREGFALCCLVPSSASLFSFYEKLGYENAFYHRQYTLSAQKQKAKIRAITAEDYRNLRQMQLYGNFIDYDPWLLNWQQLLCQGSGAGLYRIETDDAVCCAAAEIYGQTLHIKELLPDCPEAAAALAAHLGCAQAHIRTEGDALPFGMAKPLQEANLPEFSYLGFAFD